MIAPPRARAGRPVRALWLACGLGGLSQSLAGSAGALLAREVGHSGAVAGLPQGLLVIGAALSALGMAELTRRRGRGFALTAGALTAAVGCGVVVVGGYLAALSLVLMGSLLLGAGTTAVMLGRYAAADLGSEADRVRAMASVLVATTVGAVAGPNLLAPAGAFAAGLGLPVLVGPYLIAAGGFVWAAAVLGAGLRTAGGTPRPEPPSAILEQRLGPEGTTGLVVLALANLAMVSVMTMAPVHLHRVGTGLGTIGLVVSAHIAGMFLPSPVSGWLTERWGAARVAQAAGVTLAAACALAVVAAGSPVVLSSALVLVGVGWNLGLVSGSVLLTADVTGAVRARREGWGEVSMGAAAASGGAASGVVVAVGGYPTLAGLSAAAAGLILPLAWWLLFRRS